MNPITPLPVHASPAGSAATVLQFLDATHRQIDQALERLVQVATAIRQGQSGAAVQTEAAQLLALFDTQAREHHEDEERHILPALAASADPRLAEAGWKLLQDHGWIEECWRHIAPLLAQAARGGAVDADVLHEGAVLLQRVYADHMVLEESVAYPASSPLITSPMAATMRAEMQERRTRHARLWPQVTAPAR